MKWISVKDRLPNPCTQVIAFSTNGYGVESLYFDGDREFYYEATDTQRKPSHWMPLPEPPKQD
jgi:hypothetical protein